MKDKLHCSFNCYNLKLMKYLTIFWLSIALTSCGFKLRNDYNLFRECKYLVIEYNDNQEDPFYLQLQRALQEVGVTLITKEQIKDFKSLPNDNVLKFLNVQLPIINEQIHSYDSKNQILGDRISANFYYKVLDRNYNLLKEGTISRSNVFACDPNKLAANFSEKHKIIEELYIEIIQELLNQLRITNFAKLENHKILDH